MLSVAIRNLQPRRRLPQHSRMRRAPKVSRYVMCWSASQAFHIMASSSCSPSNTMIWPMPLPSSPAASVPLSTLVRMASRG